MHILKPFVVWPLLSLVAMLTLATVFIPKSVPAKELAGVVWFGEPLPFFGQDFSIVEYPPDYVRHKGALTSLRHFPPRGFNLPYFLIDALLIAMPIFLPLILAEFIVQRKRRKRVS